MIRSSSVSCESADFVVLRFPHVTNGCIRRKTGEKNPTLKTPHVAVEDLQPKPEDRVDMQGFWLIPILRLHIAKRGVVLAYA